MTTTKTKRSDQELEALVDQIAELFGKDGDNTLAKIKEKLAALETALGPVKGLEAARVHERLEAVVEGQRKMAAAIKRSRGGLYVSGMEDMADEFSTVRALMGCQAAMRASGGRLRMNADAKRSFEAVGAGTEFEIMSQATEKRRAQMAATKAAGHSADDEDSAGGFIPDQVIPDVIPAIYARSPVINLTGDPTAGGNRLTVYEGLIGGTVTVPKFDGGVIAYWQGENDTSVESKVKVGNIKLEPRKLSILVKLTEDMQRMAGYGFDSALQRDMIREATTALTIAILFGKGGANSPRGVTSTKGVRVFSAQSGAYVCEIGDDATIAAANGGDWDGGELNFDGLDNMMLALEESDIDLDDSAAIISGPRFFKRLKQIKVENYSSQTTGQPYLLGIPILPDTRLREIIGNFDRFNRSYMRPHLPGASIGAPTDSTNVKYETVIAGNWAEGALGRWAGIEVTDDGGKGAGFVEDAILMKMRLRVDFNMRRAGSLVVCPDAKVKN